MPPFFKNRLSIYENIKRKQTNVCFLLTLFTTCYCAQPRCMGAATFLSWLTEFSGVVFNWFTLSRFTVFTEVSVIKPEDSPLPVFKAICLFKTIDQETCRQFLGDFAIKRWNRLHNWLGEVIGTVQKQAPLTEEFHDSLDLAQRVGGLAGVKAVVLWFHANDPQTQHDGVGLLVVVIDVHLVLQPKQQHVRL